MTITTNEKSASGCDASALVIEAEPKFSSHHHLNMKPWQVSSPVALLPAVTATWTARLPELAEDIITRLVCETRPGSYGTMTLADGAILTVFKSDGEEFYETVGGFDVPQSGKKYRMEARNRTAAVSIVTGHITDTCPECNGYGGDDDADCPACDRTGARRGSETYQRRMSRIADARRRANRYPLPW